jgi:hypothetical protein
VTEHRGPRSNRVSARTGCAGGVTLVADRITVLCPRHANGRRGGCRAGVASVAGRSGGRGRAHVLERAHHLRKRDPRDGLAGRDRHAPPLRPELFTVPGGRTATARVFDGATFDQLQTITPFGAKGAFVAAAH